MNANTPDDWTPEQNSLFARLHKLMSESQSIFMHPNAPRLGAAEWATVAWNSAWAAAEMIGRDGELKFCDSETGEELAAERTGMLQ
jgi:hypothetical protein